MDAISVRYGENVTLPIDTGDTTDVSATIYIGNPGEVYTLSKTVSLTDGTGTFEFTALEMEIPLGTYHYQINTVDEDGHTSKYPSPQEDCDGCDSDFPQFIVCEALDKTEVS